MTFAGQVRRLARARPARQDLASRSWSTTSTSAAAAAPPTSPSRSAKPGHRALLVGAVGRDFETEYRGWLDDAGVDTSGVLVSDTRCTRRAVVVHDRRPTSPRSRRSTPAPCPSPATSTSLPARSAADFDLRAHRPRRPRRHAAPHPHVPRAGHPLRGRPLAAARVGRRRRHPRPHRRRDLPVQQRLRGRPDRSRRPAGATADVARARRHARRHARQGRRASVLPADGDRASRSGPSRASSRSIPTGVGDSFRAGFLAGIAADLGFERSAQIGCTIAASVVETIGTQEYVLERAAFLDRVARDVRRRGPRRGRRSALLACSARRGTSSQADLTRWATRSPGLAVRVKPVTVKIFEKGAPWVG